MQSHRLTEPLDFCLGLCELPALAALLLAVSAHVEKRASTARGGSTTMVLDDRRLPLPAHSAIAAQVVISYRTAADLAFYLLRWLALIRRVDIDVLGLAAAVNGTMNDPWQIPLSVLA